MSIDDLLGEPRVELSEVLSHILDKGVVLRGQVMLAVADIDLIRLDLGLLLTAVESALRLPPPGGAGALGLPTGPRLPASTAPCPPGAIKASLAPSSRAASPTRSRSGASGGLTSLACTAAAIGSSIANRT